MAQQILNIGSAANDGTGDALRDSMIKIGDNFDELYDNLQKLTETIGWGVYSDSVVSNQTITATPSKLTINSLNANTNENYLPKEIRGVSSLWDSVNNKITPINVGDSYDFRVDLTIDSKSGSPTILDFTLDIGGGASPTIIAISRAIGLYKTPPYSLSIGFPIYSLATFVANGGQIFLSVDTGSIDISSRIVFIKRDTNGNI